MALNFNTLKRANCQNAALLQNRFGVNYLKNNFVRPWPPKLYSSDSKTVQIKISCSTILVMTYVEQHLCFIVFKLGILFSSFTCFCQRFELAGPQCMSLRWLALTTLVIQNTWKTAGAQHSNHWTLTLCSPRKHISPLCHTRLAPILTLTGMSSSSYRAGFALKLCLVPKPWQYGCGKLRMLSQGFFFKSSSTVCIIY